VSPEDRTRLAMAPPPRQREATPPGGSSSDPGGYVLPRKLSTPQVAAVVLALLTTAGGWAVHQHRLDAIEVALREQARTQAAIRGLLCLQCGDRSACERFCLGG
jgi:hypothetical protein